MKIIAHINSPFKEKFSIPRQPGLINNECEIILHAPYNREEAIIGLDEYSHLWVIFGFHGNPEQDSLTVRPPRLGGNKKLGVFATRSPFRPNNLGLSLVKIKNIIPGKIVIVGGDFLDQTPVYDLKPYLKEIECIPEARSGFTDKLEHNNLKVEFLCDVDVDIKKELEEILALDPRPRFHEEGKKKYAFRYKTFDVHWEVRDGVAIVTDLKIV